ncbi:MAG: xanthine dehydrogenase family protein molybdopterin-binding subunit [Betaproteobacteria bacterium]|nr:xanthine dehydrogenase family protein molybdopterin-binding subunit [Betaproteobacteria bacterium]NBQ79675.1 xanthine dehydrogenase family protein molybdopterin-binding subunit [Betaproteobacteria bacterium]NBQ82207.1 xanthine dehydrogenase family protein molybdopterin-binding subunit [Betaproteobacteria bacterium]NBS22119.1 xanthine dehydrogenase family protein molybdopterin-binding subunit [Betaproteobacteria bacterium]NCV06553.1 xanthine dehydrogenase family protein molybdopterin-binding 
MMNPSKPNPSRRQFIVGGSAITSGLAIGLLLPRTAVQAQALSAAAVASHEIGAWVVIQADDAVIIRVVRSEMGQGTITGLAQLLAEELECDWKKIAIEYPTPGESLRRKGIWGSFSTGGSRGIRTSEEYVRKGGAAARLMLVQAAAMQWKVPASECLASNSLITHQASGRSISYGKVAEAAAKLPVPEGSSIVLKDPSRWKVIGKPMARLDSLADKVTGKQVYAIDLKIPGMLIATIKECPVFGGKLKSFDSNAVSGMKGVRKIVQVGDTAVAVVAETFWQAKTAIDKLPIVWDEGPNALVNQADIVRRLEEGLSAEQTFVGNANGDFKAAAASASGLVESQFFFPYLNHATMEPMNATAVWTTDGCRAWVPTQDGEASLAAVIAASGLPADKCDVIKVNLGGGFGRRGAFQDYTTQVVNIAKQLPGTPIKMIWTREEDMTQGRYHPIMMCKMTGSFDSSKNLTGIHMRLSGQSILASVRPAIVAQNKGMDPVVFQGVAKGGEHGISYDFPSLLVDHAMRNSHVPPGFWRGVNINQNAVFMECFIDELSEFAGMDPLEFRRKYSANHPRNLAVLNAVAQQIGWGTPAKPGVHRGIAQQHSFGSWVAAACELSVAEGNQVKIHRIVAATDPGYAVNPAQIERQISGSFVYGLSALFEEECTVKNGRIEQTNFDSFGSIRLGQMPKVETIIIQGKGKEWGGVGEPTISVAAPAVLNAMYKATGKRIRSVPLKNSGIRLV